MTFAELIYPLLFNSIVIFGIRTIFSEGMIFEKAGNEIQEVVGEFWSKPLLTCPPCMSSIHGTWFYLAYIGINWTLPVYVLALAGLNYLVIHNLDK